MVFLRTAVSICGVSAAIAAAVVGAGAFYGDALKYMKTRTIIRRNL